jgi:hypothetical protein
LPGPIVTQVPSFFSSSSESPSPSESTARYEPCSRAFVLVARVWTMLLGTWSVEKSMLRKLTWVSSVNSWNTPFPSIAISVRSPSAAGRSSWNGMASGFDSALTGKRKFVLSVIDPT